MYVEGSFNERNGHPSFECDSVEITLPNGRRFKIVEDGTGGLRSHFVSGSPHNVDRAEKAVAEGYNPSHVAAYERKVDQVYWPNSLEHDGQYVEWRVVGTSEDPVVEWRCGDLSGKIEWTVAQDLEGLSLVEAIIQRLIEATR